VHLVGIDHPKGVVFDEVHFGKFINSYLTGNRSFDIHPPHAKLIMAGVARASGYKGDFSFEKINQRYEGVKNFWLRFVPALTGVFIPIVAFILIQQLGGTVAAAFLGALLMLFDNALTVQTRVIALDGLLVLSVLGAVSLFLLAVKEKRPRRMLYFFLSGGSAGLALGTKFTGLTALGLLGLMILVKLAKKCNRENILLWLRRSVWVAAGFCFIYLLGWVFHFQLLNHSGPGDRYYKPADSFLRDTVLIHSRMYKKNSDITKKHPFASPWWSWPQMKVPIYYANDGGKKIYFLGNPVVWWGVSLFFVIALGNLLLYQVTDFKKLKLKGNHILWIPIVGFFASYLPYVPVPRPLFMYHYLPPLVFSVLVVVLWLDKIGWTVSGNLKKQRWSYYGVMGLVIVGFLMVSPVTYGYKTPKVFHKHWLSFLTKRGKF